MKNGTEERSCGDTAAGDNPPLLPRAVASARRMPGAPLDASDDLPKHRACQVAFGELQGEVPGMPNEASAGLEQSLLKTREGTSSEWRRAGRADAAGLPRL